MLVLVLVLVVLVLLLLLVLRLVLQAPYTLSLHRMHGQLLTGSMVLGAAWCEVGHNHSAPGSALSSKPQLADYLCNDASSLHQACPLHLRLVPPRDHQSDYP